MGPARKALVRGWLALLGISLVGVPLCILWIDRPLADFFAAHVAAGRAAERANAALAILKPLAFAALLFWLGAGLRAFAGRPLPARWRTLSASAAAVVLATGAVLMLKGIFGRGTVTPTYLGQGLYGFRILHMEEGWNSFPSGTAMGVFAVVGVLYLSRSRWRRAVLALALCLSAGVVVLKDHWLSDVIAGAFLGLTVGYATAGLLAAGAECSGSDGAA